MKNEMNCAKSAADEAKMTASNEERERASNEAKVRVELELSDLCEKISKLTVFLYGNGRVKANLSNSMISYMGQLLEAMKSYAGILQTRLSIWGKSDEELKGCRIENNDTQRWFG